MRNILLIATLLLGTFAVAQTADNRNTQNDDWYNQKLTAAVGMYEHVQAAAAPSVTSSSESQNATQPESMAANTGSQEGWYNQKLGAAIQQFDRENAATAPSTNSLR